MSLMMLRRCCPEARMWRRKLPCFGSMLPSRRSTRISEKPMIEFIGVRNSCDMLARNWLFSRFASWMRRLASASSRERCWSSSARRVSSFTRRVSSASSGGVGPADGDERPAAADERRGCGGGEVPDEPRAGKAAGDVDAERDDDDVDGHPERVEDAPVDAARVEPVEDAAAGRCAGAERPRQRGVERKDPDERADERGDERRGVDEQMPPLNVQIKAENALARGVGGQWTHRDGRIVDVNAPT